MFLQRQSIVLHVYAGALWAATDHPNGWDVGKIRFNLEVQPVEYATYALPTTLPPVSVLP